ncbi:GTP pyrophosphokinase [Ekhidna sp.]
MNKTEIAEQLTNKKDLYNRLGQNIVEALKTFMSAELIPYLNIYFRIKKFDSFYEKIERKKYTDPFEQIEDICGIRVICYYNSDVVRVNEIIKREFDVLEVQDKSDLLGLKEFAYRSQHFIFRTNKKWNSAPKYRDLGDLKAEIQILTVLMHAWAEIEHKLNYKSDAQVPELFQRKLFRLSAKFEEADEQFEELKEGIENYKKQLNEKITSTNKFDLSQDFNLETLKAFIKYKFPDDKWSEKNYSRTFEEFSKYENAFELLNRGVDAFAESMGDILRELKKAGYDNLNFPDTMTLLWIAIDIIDDEVFQFRLDSGGAADEGWIKTVKKRKAEMKKTKN